ncbi:MAG: PD-(D/E)XK nuclease family protein [Alphaproteobacteria bacterium]|nr:PD-(D/E)XK nuclease family protein [Alphaproteobacteria bacterium]
MSNNNVYKVSNPLYILDALWDMIKDEQDFSKVLIFLPSRRAIRVFEKKIVNEIGHAVILPYLIPLGSGVEEIGEDEEEPEDSSVMSNQERVITLACLLAQTGFSINQVLALAHDFIRMQDYIENQNTGLKITSVNWKETIGEDKEKFFEMKSVLLDKIKDVMEDPKRKTSVEKNKEEIKEWVSKFDRYNKVIVCGSTASVPTTAELMCEIAKRDNGIIILSGNIQGRIEDFEVDTNPYHSEYNFLKKLNMGIDDVKIIDKGTNENLEFFNIAFGNTGELAQNVNMDKIKLIECPRESVEAKAVAHIAQEAVKQNKSVLVITPDAAGNQRIKTEFDAIGLNADFSVGTPGNMTNVGRAILNLFDDWSNLPEEEFDELLRKSDNNILDMLVNFIDKNPEYKFRPRFKIDNEDDAPIWKSLKTMSEFLKKNINKLEKAKAKLKFSDIRGLVADTISGVSIRQKLNDECNIRVLGMVESRMQNADVVILTGLNDGMFPSKGYQNAWLPHDISEAIGLPSPNKKVSLMALDFINLSCADEVYWLRTTQSDSALTLESRFLSRVAIANGDEIERDTEILKEIYKQDEVEEDLLKFKAPCAPIGKSNIHITTLKTIDDNPYEFYIKNILGLRIEDDYWALPDNRFFGTCVHNAIENSTTMSKDDLALRMRTEILTKVSANSVLYRFWDKRIEKIAEYVSEKCKHIIPAKKEEDGFIVVNGVKVCAKADVIWNDMVLDIKTGKGPTEEEMKNGDEIQIPFECCILQQGGYVLKMPDHSQTPKLQVLQLKRGDLNLCTYEGEDVKIMMDAAYSKVESFITKYSAPDITYDFKLNTYGKGISQEQMRLINFAKYGF